MTLSKAPIPAAWTQPLDLFRSSLIAAGRREQTIKTRIDWLRHFARWVKVDPFTVEASQLVAYSGAHDWATETRRSIHASLRLFYRWAHGSGYMSSNPAIDLPAIRPAAPSPRPATDSALQHAVAIADERTTLILTIAAYTGMRRAEIAQIHARDVFKDLYGFSLVVHGKGGRQRIVPLDDMLAKRILAAARGAYLFPGKEQGHLSARYVGKLATAVLPDDWTLHNLRHRFASQAYAGTSDLLAVQQLLGHASPATTQRYIYMPDSRLRTAAGAVRRAS